MIYRGIIERIYGKEIFNIKNNSKEFYENNIKYSTNEKFNKRLFDIDRLNIRSTFMFNGGPTIDKNHHGAIIENFTNSSKWYYYIYQLERIILESINQCRIITILFNSGMHDLATNINLLDNNIYESNLNYSMKKLKIMINNLFLKRSNPQDCPNLINKINFYWITTLPRLKEWICYGGYIRYLNQIASIIAKKNNFIVLDSYSLVTGFPQETLDGLHCQHDYYDSTSSYHSYSCNRLVDLYLHVMMMT